MRTYTSSALNASIIIIALLMSAFVAQIQFVSAASIGSTGVVAIIEGRICDRFMQLRIDRPFISLPAFCQLDVHISASPASITAGQSSVLSWTSGNTDSCTASGGWSGSKATSGSQSVSPATTTSFGLTCTGPAGSVLGTTTVTVIPAPAPTLTFSANPLVITSGATSTLTWSSANITTCTASHGWSGSQALSGNLIVSPATTTSYVLDCSGLGGSIQATSTVTVNPLPLPTVSLSGDPAIITNGATSTLTWSTTNATSCTASDGWSGSQGTSGTMVISPATTTTYVLNCIGSGGSTFATTTVMVNPAPMPTLTFAAHPALIMNGATSTLSWTSSNATSCVASGGWNGAQTLLGNLIVSPTTTTSYLLGCSGLGGSIQGTTTVTVN
jgi:hypothetical protein